MPHCPGKFFMTRANADLQAVILVGPGHRLFPLVDEVAPTGHNCSMSASNLGGASSSAGVIGSSGACAQSGASSASATTCSKALLPLCNRPLIYYPLTWLIQSGVGEILIVVHQKFHSKLLGYINKQYEFAEGNKIEICPVPEYNGSLSALLSVQHRLKHDFIVVGCDLITDAPLSRLADLHRSNNALLTCLFSGPQASGLLSAPPTATGNDAPLTDPRYLASLAGEELLVALDMSTLANVPNSGAFSCRLIYAAPQADSLDETNTHLPVKMSTLCRYPRLRLRTDLVDPHVYLFSPEIFKEIQAIIAGPSDVEHEKESGFAQELSVPASLFSLREDFIPKIMRRIHRFRNSDGLNAVPSSTFAYVVDSGNYCLRANTLPALLESTRQMMKSANFSAVQRIAPSAEIPPRSQVGNDSMFGEGSKLGERSSIKKSVVGSNCTVGSNVKIINCIVMDGAIIEDGCKIEGCIVGLRATIREKSQLKDCDIAGGFCIEKETMAKAETFGSNRELVEDLY